jgi:ABC-type phosphate transport system auxiliary subunit
MHKMASDIIDIRKDMHGLRTQMKEITDILKKQFNMKQADTNMITSPPNETVARYKREEMDRRIHTIWEKQEAGRDTMLPFQARHFANRSTVESLHYESKRCSATLAEMYTEEAKMPVSSDTYSLSAYLSARIYDG